MTGKMKVSDRDGIRENGMDFAYISTAVLIIFIFLAAMNCAGPRKDIPVPALSKTVD
jgi:hypothetical protein